MGVGRRAAGWVASLGGLGFIGIAASPIAWHQAVVAGICGGVALVAPPYLARLCLAMGLAAAVSAADVAAQAAAGGLAALVVITGLVSGQQGEPAEREARKILLQVALAAGLLGLILAAKQGIAASALPAAAGGSARAWAMGLAVAGSAAVAAAVPASRSALAEEDPRGLSVHAPPRASLGLRLRAFAGGLGPLALALVLIGFGALGRLARLPQLAAPARLAAAIPLDGVPLVIDGVVEQSKEDPTTLTAALRAAPTHDGAALALGWEAALTAGWRPHRADGVVTEVARALERAGRGGEAIRLLAKHPRVGEVDALRTLFERTQGLPEDWRGGRLGLVIESHTGSLCDSCFVFMHNESREIEFTTLAEPFDAWLVVGCDGAAFEGQPELSFTLDGQTPWVVECPAEAERKTAWLAPGPHRLRIAFENDREGPGGDRNVGVTALTVLPFAGL
ncbi:hypothetical protein LBMAG42_16430 [Deltaproteobacteria bacterium]|nr:hypothetical protein LBMAG42_16430 [Deltaproteobacteria bacterium]